MRVFDVGVLADVSGQCLLGRGILLQFIESGEGGEKRDDGDSGDYWGKG
mgnify:CR=1 FL=1